MNFLDLVQKNGLTDLLLTGKFGLEKENLRTDIQGNLALTPHPKVFGDKSTNPYITTDFAEAQLEMITPELDSTAEAFDFMNSLHNLISLKLDNEYLWPYSLPPVLPANDDLIKAAQFNQPEIAEYRQYLCKKYGKRKQLLSGIHYNFSFSSELIHALYNVTDKNISYREFNDKMYLKVAREYLKYCWLIIYLFGANSVAHASYLGCCNRSMEKITNDTYDFHGSSSFRNGVSGYRNLNHFYVSYNSLAEYIQDINNAINKGEIIAAKEYYSQVRLKGHSKSHILDDLAKGGVNYIEIRTLDLNPLTKLGITLEQMDFMHLMLIYCLLAPDFYMSNDDYKLANFNQLLAADANRDQDIMLHCASGCQKSLRLWGTGVLQHMHSLFASLGIHADKLLLIQRFKEQLCHNSPSIASTIMDGVKNEGYAKFFMNKSFEYLAQTKDEQLHLAQQGDNLRMSGYTQQIFKSLPKQ
ncbi:MAG: hypothetical protein KBD37_05620 [Burkholderiales bacterium]|nr:hypothetical protein [Burkholderiales bacterium]